MCRDTYLVASLENFDIHTTIFMNLPCFQVGETGRAVGIDHINELIKFSQENIERDSPELLSSGTVKLVG